MATTQHYNWPAPVQNDVYDIDQYTTTLNHIDQLMWETNQAIEALDAGSDVVDVVGVYDKDNYTDPKPNTDLVHYDLTTITTGDIIKVLQDESQIEPTQTLLDAPISYYRKIDVPSSSEDFPFTLIGTLGPFPSKSQVIDLMPTVEDVVIPEPPVVQEYLCFRPTGPEGQIGYTITGSIDVDIYCSTDQENWEPWDGTYKSLDDSLYVWNKNDTLSTSSENYLTFTLFGTEVYSTGSINSMINFSNLSDYCFYHLFENCNNLTSVNSTSLPSTSLASHCYEGMFKNSAINMAPELPATETASGCYREMFEGCINMSNLSINYLPATMLTEYCYEGMFKNSGVSAAMVELPADYAATGCYRSMFEGCKNLGGAPTVNATHCDVLSCYKMFAGSNIQSAELFGTELVEACYSEIFDNCGSLQQIKIHYTGDFDAFYFDRWVSGVASDGTILYNGRDTTRGESAIPDNWTIEQF